MRQYFPRPYNSFGRDNNVKVDLSNYATKKWFKRYCSCWYFMLILFALKLNLANLKTEIDKLDIDKLKSLPSNLSNLKTKVD